MTAPAVRPTTRLLAGRYRQVRLLGEGSAKRVDLVHDEWLGREVAACSLREPGVEQAARLRREASVLAQLGGCPAVVAVHDLLELDGPVLICQYLAGGTLRDRLRQGPVDIDVAVALAREIATALAATHAAGLLHRDVEPGNVLLAADGRAVLGDFGLSVPALPVPTDLLVGTPPYTAPEQLVGERCDARSDLWSLGAVLYELLVGCPPVQTGAVVDLVARTLTLRPARPSLRRAGIPAALDDLVLQLLAADPDDRPPTADDVVAALVRTAPPQPPAQDRGRSAGGFVGREPELDQLGRALADAAGGTGSLTLLHGDAGVGKTRVALELARRAQDDGWVVLTARCPEDAVAPPYWPWTQLLRTALRTLPDDDQPSDEDRRLLAPLLPGPDAGGPPDVEPSRLQLFDAVARLLRQLSVDRPVLVLLDDVHWADAASVLLIAHVARELLADRVAVVACARPDEDDERPFAPVSALAGAATATLRLHGLSVAETGCYLAAALDVRADRLLLQELHERTDGNPFHVAELVRLLQSESVLTSAGLVAAERVAPTGLREVLRRRLAQVPPPCLALLQTMSVVGREAALPVLALASGLGTARVLALLEQAVTHRLVVQVPGQPPRFRFTHALVRESLYDSLPATRRAQLHQRTTEALLRTIRHEREAPAAELAHHAVRASAHGDPAPAVLWSIRAARAAALSAAHEDAVLHLGRAVDLAGALRLPSADGTLPSYGDLLIELGEAQRVLGQSEQARLTFLRAAGEALTDDDAGLLARSALGHGLGLGGFGYVDRADGILLSLLEEALAAMGEQDTPLRVRVLARLATELYFTPFRRRRLTLSREAVEVAQRLGDPASELLATYSRTLALLGPDRLDEQRRTADRVVWLAEEQADPDMAFRGHHLRLMVALETGAREQARAEAAACRRIADVHRQATHEWHARVFEAMLVLGEGRHSEALVLAERALQAGIGGAQMAQVMHGAQVLVASWGQGRLDELLELVRAFADDYPHAPAWRATLAFCCTETGRLDVARAELEVLATRDFADLPEDGNYLVTAALLAHVAARLGDVSRARQLEAKLRPYADRHVIIAAGAVCFPSVRLPLGVARAACGDLDGAVRDLTAAHRLHQEASTPALAVWCAEELVRVLLTRGRPEDLATCWDVLDSALPEARSLGMTAHLVRLDALAEECARRGASSTGSAEDGGVTVLISDVAASTRLTEALGESAVQALLGEHRRLVEVAVGAEGGLVLKAIGDAVLAALPSADAALRCAAELQQRVESADSPVHVRIGLHTGPVLRQGDSMYGRTMIVASRIADLAQAGEVLVSGETRSAARTSVEFEDARSLHLKGIGQPQEVSRLRWRPGQRRPD